jgi:hypothetical protein
MCGDNYVNPATFEKCDTPGGVLTHLCATATTQAAQLYGVSLLYAVTAMSTSRQEKIVITAQVWIQLFVTAILPVRQDVISLSVATIM